VGIPGRTRSNDCSSLSRSARQNDQESATARVSTSARLFRSAPATPSTVAYGLSEMEIMKNRILLLEDRFEKMPKKDLYDERISTLVTRVDHLERENEELRSFVCDKVSSSQTIITERTDTSISKLASILRQLLERERRALTPPVCTRDKEIALKELNQELSYIKRRQ
jgi:hypothetical protein